MHVSGKWTRRAILWSATGALTAATIVAGSSAEAAHSPGSGARQSRTALRSKIVGYPAPKGIYKPFTNCPLVNPLMQESSPGTTTGCIAGDVNSGSIKIGNVTTKIKSGVKVKYPVSVQFGIWDPPNAGSNQWNGGILPPPDGGLSAQLISTGQYVPGGLLKALGCPDSKFAVVKKLCAEAQKGSKYNNVFASAQSAGPITGFTLGSWFQPVMFHLTNPLLGNSCYIGSADNPVVLNPQLTATAEPKIEPDPHPKQHPNTGVIKILATAADTTFTAPGVTGCGPGGSANIHVDEAIDTAVGLPTASGADSITLSGTFYIAASAAPHNMAKVLLSAFRESARSSGSSAVRQISFADLRHGLDAILKHFAA
jgi:hypothetical protein